VEEKDLNLWVVNQGKRLTASGGMGGGLVLIQSEITGKSAPDKFSSWHRIGGGLYGRKPWKKKKRTKGIGKDASKRFK